ncbi:initiation factor 2B [Thermosipho melanesiensis]|uniref:Initiation factor 2B related n=2 Tax=Thermosipho melanesiensis TaxID=46541 RepID=A6LM81_THEM4|nr:initiation factor 2B [Thermosipho melanesiensis]ABR31032.1 initiation factor 2B related [Thermosipho melanesiensis BI429]APT74126.1 initiation factor 2B [Thermosipho melanesiensis]OOC36074.1 initiation factor 2B [Thermosipho melanesiensis]OOC36891.1 initiation factor 2B [Thermosipho melanesiensis]OOC37642.1 initiation factor 2B [Thermosipho melanesiensis]
MDDILKHSGSVEIGFWLLDEIEKSKNIKILEKLLQQKQEMSILKWIKHMIDEGYGAKNIRRILRTSFENTIKYARKFLNFDAKVVTISNSKTLEIFFKTHQKNLEIIIPISNPGGEGKLLYNNLKTSKHTVTLVDDFKIEKHIRECDYVITGADAVSEIGVINKVGTKTLAILAKYHKKPFFVIADKTKFIDSEIKSDIFELVPFELITAIISGEL